ncbi:MAG TPA: hypothetical protein VHG08_03750 [Longimicrobium sp.]|nr:hypothetical protein [Longimicrobium sp.]
MNISQLTNQIRALPSGISPYRDIDGIDTSVELYSGSLQVEHEGGAEDCDGSIFFCWLPSPTLRFEAATRINPGTSVTVRIPTQIFVAEGFVTSSSESHASGVLNGSPRLGMAHDSDEVWFQLANFHSYIGDPVRFGTDTHPVMHRNRITFPSPRWEVTIDEVADYDVRLERLRDRGGYEITHTGILRKTDGATISVTEADEVLSGLHFFLSFAGGGWCTPIFSQGKRSGEALWEQVGAWRVSVWKPVVSWFPIHPATQAVTAWAGFIEKWFDPDWQYPLRIAIHWYVEANRNAGAVEGAVVLTQTALELLAWAVVVEERALIDGKIFKKVPAAEKIRLLLREMQIPNAIPKELSALTEAARKLKTAADPEILVRLRNGIVHSSKSKRADIAQIVDKARWEALQYGLWCLELAILRICNYNGVYADRLRHKYVGQVANVPWVT